MTHHQSLAAAAFPTNSVVECSYIVQHLTPSGLAAANSAAQTAYVVSCSDQLYSRSASSRFTDDTL